MALPTLQSWWQADAVLPTLALTRWSMPVSWAVVLVALVCVATRRRSPWWRWTLSGMLALWALLPVPGAPGRVLGLAFQAPSLLSLLVCADIVARAVRPGLRSWTPVPPWLMWVLSILGWVLLLDTFAWTPGSIYAWGFGVPALVVLLATATLLVRAPTMREGGVALGFCLGIYVATRLPTGNVWDALLDPLLWLVLQARLLRAALRAWRARAATHAAAASARAATDLPD